jgi:hypothetical protein
LRRETLARLHVESALSRSAAIEKERGERGEGMALALRENTEESGWKAAVSKTE